jgi:hypothetical protein
MRTRYVAYGLELHSSFSLPGMSPSADERLPSLTVELVTPEELAAAWSGSDRPPEWIGRLGDGCDLTIERGSGEDLLFSYGRRARFLLTADGRSLMCAPRRTALSWQQALLGKVLPSISVQLGYEALHASAVNSPSGVVAILAPSGTGKTSVAIELMRRGWGLFADDVLTLADTDGEVLAHRGAPHMNVAQDQPDELPLEEIGATLGVLAGERWVAARSAPHAPQAVCLLCLLERCSTLSLDAQVLSPSPLPLAPYMLGLRGHAERERRRFTLYANLMSSTTLMRITCDLADLIERSLTKLRDTPVAGVAA